MDIRESSRAFWLLLRALFSKSSRAQESFTGKKNTGIGYAVASTGNVAGADFELVFSFKKLDRRQKAETYPCPAPFFHTPDNVCIVRLQSNHRVFLKTWKHRETGHNGD